MCAICDFKIEFGVGHPQALAQARLRMTAVETLNGLQGRVQEALSVDELLCLPDFYVLLIENETWGFFHATEDGFDPDIVPERPDVLADNVEARSLVIVTSQVALQAWLDSEIDTGQLNTESLLFIDGPAEQRHSLLSMLNASAATADGPRVAVA